MLIICAAFKAQADVIKGAEAALTVEIAALRKAAATHEGRSMCFDSAIIVRELQAWVVNQPHVVRHNAADQQEVHQMMLVIISMILDFNFSSGIKLRSLRFESHIVHTADLIFQSESLITCLIAFQLLSSLAEHLTAIEVKWLGPADQQPMAHTDPLEAAADGVGVAMASEQVPPPVTHVAAATGAFGARHNPAVSFLHRRSRASPANSDEQRPLLDPTPEGGGAFSDVWPQFVTPSRERRQHPSPVSSEMVDDQQIPAAGDIPADVAPADAVGPFAPNAGSSSAGAPDAGPSSAGAPDTGPSSAGALDASPSSAGASDAGPSSAGACTRSPSPQEGQTAIQTVSHHQMIADLIDQSGSVVMIKVNPMDSHQLQVECMVQCKFQTFMNPLMIIASSCSNILTHTF